MTHRSHQLRLSREANELARQRAATEGKTKERYLADLVERYVDEVGPVPEDNGWVVTKVVLPDEAWEALNARAKALQINASALLEFEVNTDADAAA